jgi:hypothetical protein
MYDEQINMSRVPPVRENSLSRSAELEYPLRVTLILVNGSLCFVNKK